MASVGVNRSHRLCVTDFKRGTRYLIDTGADVSVLACKKPTQKPCDYTLYAANGTPISTYGEKTITIDLGLRRPLRWTFILANVQRSIIGADFLAENQLMVDLHGRKLVDKLTNISKVTQIITEDSFPSIRAVNSNDPYHKILMKYPDITKMESFKAIPKHDVVHHICTNGPPVFEKARPLNPVKYKAAKQEFERMVELGICRPSTSPWANALHVVNKKNGELRPCGDYRRLNAITEPDRYPLPRLTDFTYILKNKKIMSKIDIRRAYHNIAIAPEDIPKSAIITPFGLYEFTKMNFGLRNAAQSFQRFINNIMKNMKNTFCYLDDILVASESETDHINDLDEVFKRLNKYGVTINTSKCAFGKTELTFLGYNVTCDGIKPDEEKVKAISEYPQPNTIEELRRFLGLINFYRTSIPRAAETQTVLDKYLHNSKKRDKTKIIWTEESIKAFNDSKKIISEAVTLAHPDPDAKLVLMTDASNSCVGAALHQVINEELQPLGFYSKKLNNAQTKYSTYDRELLAIYMAIKHFRYVIEGRDLTVLTDHKPLTYALSKKESKSDSPRRLRQLDFIAQFCTKINYVEGKSNSAADFLSRIEEIHVPDIFDYEQLHKSQIEDTELQKLKENDNLQFKLFTMPYSKHELVFETSTPQARLYLPAEFRKQAIITTHGFSHPGIAATRRLIAQRYFWPNMNTDVTHYVKHCIKCQKSKINRHTITPLGEFEHSERFTHVHIDIIGPMTPSEDHRYCITIIDRTTKWPEVIPTKDITAETVANKFIEQWVSRYGCPVKITTDRGSNFESQLFTQLMKCLGIEKLHTTAYNPKANGQIERFNRTVKCAILARCNDSNQWVRELPIILLGLRSTIKEDIGFSPAQMTYGKSIRLPGDFFIPTKTNINATEYTSNLMGALATLQPATRKHVDNRKIFIHKDLKCANYVFVRRGVKKSLTPPYEGPFKVLERFSKYFTLQIGSRNVAISLDRLKPAYVINTTPETTEQITSHNLATETTEQQIVSPNSTETIKPPDTAITKHDTTTPKSLGSTKPKSFNGKTSPVVTRSGRTIKKTVRFDM